MSAAWRWVRDRMTAYRAWIAEDDDIEAQVRRAW